MLHTKTIDPETLSLIQSLQTKAYIKDFLLVGGTALALQLGHRTSTDIDLFTNSTLDVGSLLTFLQADYNISIRHRMNHALLLDVKQIKTDFVFQRSEIIGEIIQYENIRMASLEDIAAMKISAITARGRKRDFVDLYCILKYYSLLDTLHFFLKKYRDATPELAIKSLFYFSDVDEDFDPKCFFKYDWKIIKKTIQKEAQKL